MKKIFLMIIFFISIISLTSSTTIEIHSINNQEMHVTPLVPNDLILNDKEDLPKFVITGFAVYTENKNIIIPVYYSLITFLLMMVIFNILFKKIKPADLIDEAEELLNEEKEKESKKNGLITEEKERKHKEEMESIPKIEPTKKTNEIKKKIKKEETSIDTNEIFNESEEKLESEIKEEIKEEKSNLKPKETKGQPTPLNADTRKIKNSKKLIKEAKKLEKE